MGKIFIFHFFLSLSFFLPNRCDITTNSLKKRHSNNKSTHRHTLLQLSNPQRDSSKRKRECGTRELKLCFCCRKNREKQTSELEHLKQSKLLLVLLLITNSSASATTTKVKGKETRKAKPKRRKIRKRKA